MDFLLYEIIRSIVSLFRLYDYYYTFISRCSIDPYIFSNFETPDDGDTLKASFKAFKFPESNYVMFSGTVSICINKCKGVSKSLAIFHLFFFSIK